MKVVAPWVKVVADARSIDAKMAMGKEFWKTNSPPTSLRWFRGMLQLWNPEFSSLFHGVSIV